MPQDYKTSINNLIIVWQGSSWSVIAPNGTVIARSFDKSGAEDYAKTVQDYVSKQYHPYSGILPYDTMPPDINNSLDTDTSYGTLPFHREWLSRHDIFRTTVEANPPFFIGVSIGHDSKDYLLVMRSDINNSQSSKMMYINPAHIAPNDVPIFRFEIMTYGKIPSRVQVLGRPTYFENIDLIYVAAGETQVAEDKLHEQHRSIEIRRIYRKRNGEFRAILNTSKIDLAHWLTKFITRAEKSNPAIDQRVPIWNGSIPTFYGLYIQQLEIERNKRQHEQNNFKPK